MRAIPCEFQRTVVIAAPVEDVFAFHANPDNIPKISPSWQSIRIAQGGQAEVSGEFEIEVRLLGTFTLRWLGIWREVARPVVLVDEARRSPFAFWRHRHVFERIDACSTRMTDHVTYAFAGGWLGKIFGETFGRMQFVLMFADRQARTRRVLEAHEH